MDQQEFLDKYKIKATFDDMYKSYGYLNHLDDYLTSSPGKGVDQMKYIRGLNFMFSKIMEQQIDPTGKEPELDMNTFSYAMFLRDFEDVMKTDHINSKGTEPREPYEGDELKAATSLLETAKKYNQPKILCLKDAIKAGANLDDFRKKTTHTDEMDEEQMQYCKHAAATMYRVMTTIANERTWKDRINPLNWWGMLQESLYKRSLKNELKYHIGKMRPHAYEDFINGKWIRPKDRFNQAASDFSTFDNHDVINENDLSVLKDHCDKRAAAIESEKNDDSAKRINMPIEEASLLDQNSSVATQELYQNANNKNLNNTFDSSML